ncbi:sigma-70 family RNA polymerase sigma factor [Nocardioides sp. SR21]|uniref:sigma-70 family RNA polymerase sigma factor n=1 Tax=Nocardioides sp. SR21 TaxID=2919501 RepID=UPI001FA99E19|nr:sigma-70 family RNA polymerase sigma factor [Nocardioides sp. SR21]
MDPYDEAALTRSERIELTARLLRAAWHCDDPEEAADLREQVVLLNRGVAEAVALRYRNRGLAQDDLNQVAYEGLTKAVLRFDPTLRKDLLSYAVPTIRGELQRYFRDHGWVVRPPRRIQEQQWQVGQLIEELGHELGTEPTAADVADALGVPVEEYRETLSAFGCFQPASLDQSTVGGSTVADLLISEDRDGEAADARVALAPVVRGLSERDRLVLYLRYFEDRTQEEIGQDLGVTQMQVSRLLNRILGTLRDELVAT